MGVEHPKYVPQEDACEECGIRRGVVLSRKTEKLLCWNCYRQTKTKRMPNSSWLRRKRGFK